MFCPNYKNKEVFNDFNKIVESFGGQPLSKSEFISRTLRAERYGRNKFAMDAAYFLWDKTQGDMQVLARDEDFINNKVNDLIPTPEDVLNIEEVEEFISEMEQEVEQEEEIRGEEEINYSERNIIEYNKSLENLPKIFPSEENVNNNKEELKKVTNNIKPGVSELFEQSPELTNIGTPEQYSQYLDTIFPDSKVKDLVYHGTDVEGLQQFSLKYFGQKDVGDRGYGIYLSKDRDIAQGYGEHLYSVLVNIQNPYNVRFKDNDPSYLWNRIERNSYSKDIEQLEKDRGKWIERVNNGDIRYTFFEGLSKKATKKEQLEFVNDKINKRISDKQERLDELNIIGKSDGVINEDYEIVTKPEQIHILGSKQDIQGFKEFIKGNKSKSEQELLKSFSQEQINEFVDNFDSYYSAYSQSIVAREDRIIFINKVVNGEYKIIC
jgi:hypothetical protein